MWTSTRWVSLAQSVPHTERSSASRVHTRAGVRISSVSRSNSVRVSESSSAALNARRPSTSTRSGPCSSTSWSGTTTAARGGAGCADAGRTGSADPAARAAEQRVDAGLELAHAERLGQEVVGAGLEPQQPVDLVVARGDHHDVGVGDLADAPAGLDAVDPGQPEVEGDQVGVELPDRLDAVEPVSTERTTKPCVVRVNSISERMSSSSSTTTARRSSCSTCDTEGSLPESAVTTRDPGVRPRRAGPRRRAPRTTRSPRHRVSPRGRCGRRGPGRRGGRSRDPRRCRARRSRCG